MLQIYASAKEGGINTLCIEDIQEYTQLNNKWINLINPTDKEIADIAKLTTLPEEVFKVALDEEERARFEHEEEYDLVLFDVPMIEEEEGYYSYSTLPLAFILTQTFCVTVSIKDTAILKDFIMNRIKTFSTHKRTRFLYQVMYNTADKYLNYLKQIDKASGRIQNELHKSTKNKELIQLLDLENSLVYFSTSLKGNDMVITKLTNAHAFKKYDEDIELLEDVAIETKQAIEMTSIYRDILSGTMDAYASVISNNLNIVMKVLTSITFLLSIPTLIASIWGMNTWVPGEGSWIGFAVVVSVTLIISIIVGIFLKKKKML